MRRSAAFTILELMVAAAVASMLGLVMVGIYSTAVTSLNLASGKQEVQTQCRFAIEKMVPYISSAVPDPVTGKALVVSPSPNNFAMEFYSNEDLLSPNPAAFNPRALPLPPPHRYRIGQISLNAYDVTLTEVVQAPSWPAPRPSPRVISRSLNNATVRYQTDPNSEYTVWITASAQSRVRRANRTTGLTNFTLNTAVTVPSTLKQ